MAQAVLRIDWLPASALEAADEFHESWLDEARRLLEGKIEALAIVVPPAPYDHADWRRAVVRALARAGSPSRVNLIAGDDREAIEATLAYLEHAPGITGQLLSVTGHRPADRAD